MNRALVRVVVVLALLSAGVRAEVSPGEILISEMNCVACHEASEPVRTRLASRQSPRLGADGVRARPEWLRAFLADPQGTKPGTLKPDTLHTLPTEERAQAVEALTHFLVSLQTLDAASDPQVGPATLASGRRLYHEVGCVLCHAPEEPPPGVAPSATATAELAKLQASSVPMGDLASKFTVGELAAFLHDPLKSRPSGRMPALKLATTEAEAIAAWLLRAPKPEAGAAFRVDPALAARGREYFAQLNCAACHTGTDLPARPAKPLLRLTARQPAGCIAAKPKPGGPRFELTDRQRVVIHSALGNQENLAAALEPAQQLRRTLTVLNCYACHHRDHRGGVDASRRGYLVSTGPTDLGEEGRIPPHLNAIGARLPRATLETMLIEGQTRRPFLATRMPLYGAANIGHLAALFAAVDSRPEPQKSP